MVKRIVVLGAGISGVGAAVLAKKKGFEVFVSDKGKITEDNKKVLLNNEIDLVINTTEGKQSIQDSAAIRRTALQNKIFCTTTMFGAFAIMQALESKETDWTYKTLQEINT